MEIRSPEHVVVEIKPRRDGRVNSLEVTNVVRHRRQRGADHAIIVATGFAPKVIENVETTGLTTMPSTNFSSSLTGATDVLSTLRKRWIS